MSRAATEVGVRSRGGGSATDHASAAETEALFKEARRRRRRRRAGVAAALVVVVGALIASDLLAGNGSDGHALRPTHPAAPGRAPHRPQHKNPGAVPIPYSPAQSMGLADGQVDWVATGVGLEITADGGRTWRTVTPPTLRGMSVSEHVTAVDAVGTEDLWVVLEDVPGLVPFGQSVDGSDRGEGVDRSTDGGRTWTFGAVPAGCLQTCGPISLHFVDPDHGFAASSVSGGSTLFATQDGGATWAPVGVMPNLGSVAVGGTLATPQLLFTSALDGWAVTGPAGYGAEDQPTSPGGILYRTTDGGHTWSTAGGLPAGAQYSLPVFFGADRGVVLAVPAGKGDQGSAAYVTGNGGATWEPHRIPSFRGAEFKGGSLQSRFAAVGPLAWRIDVGPHLYETTNGGRRWTAVRPVPSMGLGNVWGVAFSSPLNGLAIGLPPGCSVIPEHQTTTSCSYPVLMRTTDGGHRWGPAPL